jgi:hypothetical protein
MWRENAFTVMDDNRMQEAPENAPARSVSSQRA